MNSSYLFIELKDFNEAMGEYFRSDAIFARFQSELADDPDKGNVIPGAGPLRKVRWSDKRRGAGKRGGLRIIYVHIPDIHVLVLMDIYDKNEADDLSATQKRALQATAKQLIADIRKRYK